MSYKRLWAQKNKLYLWTAINHFKPGILGWVIGDHRTQMFEPRWAMVSLWQYFFYVTDGYQVYRNYIPKVGQIVSKIYMTRFEGKNSRLRHYLTCLYRKTLCYSKSIEMLKRSI